MAARNPYQARRKNRPSTMTAPTRPSSSPITEKMKSVWALGSRPHFWRPPPRPRPNTWPEPRPISDCHTWYPDPARLAPGLRNERIRSRR